MVPAYTDRGLSKALAQRAKLSILIGVDSVVFGVLDTDARLRAAHWVARPAEAKTGLAGLLRGLPAAYPVLGYAYDQTHIAVDSYFLTLTPQRLAEPGNDRLFLQQQSPLPDDLYVGHALSPDERLRLSYGYPAATKVWLDQQYGGIATQPFAAVLLDGIDRLAATTQRLYLHVQDQRLHLTFADGTQLIYHNRFPFQTAKDFLYYVLLIYDQFGLSPESVPVYLSGTILPDGELYQLLFRYVRHLHLAAPPEGITFGDDWNPAYAHTYYPLLVALTA